jgi:prepilin signal peptidase PulO-like enzyme (type II secretory pathway)
MEILSFALPFAALVFLTIIVGGLMNYYMDQRGFAFNPYLTYLLLPAIVVALYLVGGFSMWTVKGIVLALILLYASLEDLSEHQADDFLWVMLVILSLVNFGDVGIGSMIFGAIAVFVPQMAIAMFTKKGGIGGADIKLSTAAALSLGFYGGVIGFMIGLILGIVFELINNKIKKRKTNEPFAFLPFISTGLMIGYFI